MSVHAKGDFITGGHQVTVRLVIVGVPAAERDIVGKNKTFYFDKKAVYQSTAKLKLYTMNE